VLLVHAAIQTLDFFALHACCRCLLLMRSSSAITCAPCSYAAGDSQPIATPNTVTDLRTAEFLLSPLSIVMLSSFPKRQQLHAINRITCAYLPVC
jgi:hypothetical protein